MNPLAARPKLIDFVPEIIRFGPPKFVAEFLQALQLGLAFLNHLRRQIIEPLNERNDTVLFLVKNKFSSSQTTPLC